MRPIRESGTGQSPISRSELDALDTVCGFQEMPGWNTGPLAPELSKNVELIPLIDSPITNSLLQDGLSPAGGIVYTSGS